MHMSSYLSCVHHSYLRTAPLEDIVIGKKLYIYIKIYSILSGL